MSSPGSHKETNSVKTRPGWTTLFIRAPIKDATRIRKYCRKIGGTPSQVSLIAVLEYIKWHPYEERK